MKLTLPQQDIYYEQLVYPNSPIYNIGAKIEIKGNIAFEVLNNAYKKLINQHDAYRSYVVHENNAVAIKINKDFTGELEYLDYTQKSDTEAYANSFMQQKMTTPFSLQKDTQLHYFVLIKVDEASYYLFSMYHHIITDGWGTSLMFQRLVKNYNELFESKGVTTTYPFTYTDFVLDDAQYAVSESYEKDKQYWVEKFKQLPEELLIPKKNKKITPISDRQTLTIKRETYDLLMQLGKQNGGSTFHVILAILFLYFGRKYQNDEFAIGLPVLNRGKSIFKKTVGLFMGVSPLKIAVNLEENFGELINEIRSQLRLDYRHQRFPLGKIIKELKLYTEKNRLFDITFSYEKQNYADHFLNTKTKVIPLSHQAERVALALYIREFDNTEDVLLDFDYNLNYFDEKEIKKVVTHIDNLINELIKTPVKSLHSYTYLTEKETEIVLKEFNSTHYKYPLNQTVVDQVIAQVRLHPDKIAVEDGIKQYTYAQLDELSTKVASYILKSSDSVAMPIAILMNRSVDLIVTLIGIIKAGKAFIPLDPSFPKARLSYILAHSETSQIIGNEELENTIEHTGEYISIETILTIENIEKQVSINKSKPENTAYIIYTSGSTGNPKGVAIAHHSLLNFLISMKQSPKIEENDRFFSVTTQSFDISILEFFTPLLCGSTLFIAKEHVLQEPSKTIEAIKKNNTTIIQATPSFYQLLFNGGWKGSKKLKILCGGDLLSTSLAEKLLENCGEVWNMYGPTETTIWSSCKKIQKSTDASCIGKPIHNTKMYVLDEKLQLLPIGSAGNIYISGDGVAQGYYKNDELTNERFIKNPYEIAGKMYNTGDVGNWNEKGEIEFLGRNDHQVKIRGYRIELGDIEAKLEAISTIKQAVVVAKKNKNQEAFLLAYITKETEEFSVSTTFSTLSTVLPNYMIPNTIIEVAEFPLTPNKKVDRKQLTERELSNQSNDKIKQKPSSILEKHVAEIFREVLELKNTIGIDENFFELGGHSLNAVKVVNAIEQELSYKIYLETIFNNPTIQKLANYLTTAKTDAIRQIISSPELPFYPITFSQYAIWLASLQSEKSIAYNMFAAYEIDGKIDTGILETTFNEIINKHEILRTNFVEVDGKPCQKIQKSSEVSFTIDTFQINSKNDLRDYANKEFNLETALLLRVGIFKDDSSKDTLVFVTHHIIMDGWSLEVLITEVKNRYIALQNSQYVAEKKLAIQFKDYAIWQNDIETKDQIEVESFWKSYLKNYQWGQLVTYDYSKPSKDYAGKFYVFNWNAAFLKSLNNLALKNKVTLNTLLITAFNIILYREYQREDICIGTINSGRVLAELNQHIGMFVKTVPLRTRIQSTQKITDVLATIQEDMTTIDKHQNIPNSILNDVRLKAILVLQNPTYDYSKIKLAPNLELSSKTIDAKYNRVPLLLDFSINEDFLHGSAHYDTEKYSEETMTFLILKFELLLKQMTENVNLNIDDINIEFEFEKEETLEIDFNF